MRANVKTKIRASPLPSNVRSHPRSDIVEVTSYEKRLEADPRWALSQGSQYFEGKGAVQNALRKITGRLNELGIPYSVVGGLALFRHGYRRFTEDADLLVTRDGLKLIHEKLEGLGYVAPFRGSKHLRDTEFGVKIEFLVTGEFPGDGKPQPVSFPEPISASTEYDGIRYLNLNSLVELKLASGMTNVGRAKDLVDVMELIKALNLPREYTNELNPSVRKKFQELWRNARRRFMLQWRNKFLTTDAKSLDEMIEILRSAVHQLEAMKADGVVLDPEGGTADDYARLITTDPKIAEKYDMHDESEFWEEHEHEEEEPQAPGPAPDSGPTE